MHSTYPLLLLLWSLLSSSTFAAPQARQNKGLRYNNDIYTVRRDGNSWDVYTPYYEKNKSPVTVLSFPTAKELVVETAWNGEEKAHADGSARLHLSDVIQAVASSRNANVPLRSVDRITGRTVVNDEALLLLYQYYQSQRQPGAKFPEKLTIYPSDPHWPSFQKTKFYKLVSWTFKGTGKTIGSVDIVPRRPSLGFFQSSMYCYLKDA
ncbi:hypothetical protein LZ31DRAFT_259835 [Colletotrichum somersetense]|nr:hypothetical protein LZ31DRAFT_259835 [Colletotrichum somersetense]